MRLRTLLLAVPILLLPGPNPVRSEPARCKRAIAKESSKFLQSTMKGLGRCEDGKASGRFAPNTDCHAEAMTALLLSRTQAKLQRRGVPAVRRAVHRRASGPAQRRDGDIHLDRRGRVPLSRPAGPGARSGRSMLTR
jgi:hypothetical protein